MPTSLHINPQTGTPYFELNEFTYKELEPSVQKLYKWEISSQRYVYYGTTNGKS